MQQTEDTPAARATGRWTNERTTVHHPAASETVDVHTFTNPSGYTAVMKHTRGSRMEPYTAEIRGPDGHIASRMNEDGHRTTGMTIHLNLKDAKTTVEEAVHQVEQQAGR